MNCTLVSSSNINCEETLDNKGDDISTNNNKKSSLKILYFALIINSDEIKTILDTNQINLHELFSPDLTIKLEFHVTLWYAASTKSHIIKKYYTEIRLCTNDYN